MKRVLAILLAVACAAVGVLFVTRPRVSARSPPIAPSTESDGSATLAVPPASSREHRTGSIEIDSPAQREHASLEREQVESGDEVERASSRAPDYGLSGQVLGHVVDPHEHLPPGIELQVCVRPGGSSLRAVDEPLGSARVDPLTRRFALESVPVGKVQVVLEVPLLGRQSSREVEVRSGEASEVVLRYVGPDLGEAIWVRFEPPVPGPRPFGDDLPDPEWMSLLRDGKEVASVARRNQGRAMMMFRHLDPGLHELVVDDPRFDPVRRDGLEPGRGIVVRLAGSSSLALRVRDAASGAALGAYDAWLVRGNPFRGIARILRLDTSDAAEAATTIHEGLVAGWEALVVATRGKGRARIPLSGLRAGGRTDVALTLGERRSIRGRVVETTGEPVAGVEVRLEAPSAALSAAILAQDPELADCIGDASLAPYLLDASILKNYWDRHAGPGAWTAAVRTNERGEFVFEGLVPAAWIVRVAEGAYSRDGVAIDLQDEDVAGIELLAPRSGDLAGRLDAPEAHDLSGAVVELRWLEAPVRTARIAFGTYEGHRLEAVDPRLQVLVGHDDSRSVFVEPEADGTFRASGLPAGEHALSLILENGRYEAAIGSVTIEAGRTTETVFELADWLPGTVDVDAHWNGAPAARHVARLERATKFGIEDSFVLDGNGRGQSDPLPPGEWILYLYEPQKQFPPCHAEKLLVEAGCARSVRIEGHDVTHRLTVQARSDGRPISYASLHWRFAELPDRSWEAGNADSHGAIELDLAPRTYLIELEDTGEMVAVEWLETGPVPAIVTFSDTVTER